MTNCKTEYYMTKTQVAYQLYQQIFLIHFQNLSSGDNFKAQDGGIL